MSLEYIILLIAWSVTTILLITLTPKNKAREAWVIFLFKKIMTWSIGLIVVEGRMIEYPIRLFSYANRASFTFEFFVYPAFCVIFNLHFPNKKSTFIKSLYYGAFVFGLVIIEVILEINTQLINYIKWNWILSSITLYLTFLFSRKFYLWFFKINNKNDIENYTS